MKADGMTYPRVELIYDPDCPNVERARAAIREALKLAAVPEKWLEWDRGAPGAAPRWRAFGSPTVLVNGRDVGTHTPSSPSVDANSCRIYPSEDGSVSGAPSSQRIHSAIMAELENDPAE